MAKQIINLGSAANDGTGDKLRVAFDKVNDNFTELYDMGGGVGAQGEQGATGAKGEVGAQGVAGTTGAQGVQGAAGTKGDKGNIGAQGSSGASSDRITNGGYNLIVQPQGHVTVPTSAYATAQVFSASGVDFYLGTLDAGNYWEFKADGTLKLPGVGAIVDANNNSVLGGGAANTANVTFQDNIVVGTGVGQSDGLYLAAGSGQVGNLQYLRLRGGDDDAHIHFDTANAEAYDQYWGDDNKYVKLERGYSGNVVISSSGVNGKVWTFSSNGDTIFPNYLVQQTIHLGTRSSIKYLDDQIIQQSGNAAPDTFYTITNQEDSFWETYTQKDVTGGNSAWSWIQSETADANNPYVLIETKKLDGPSKTWIFTANGTLNMPGAINFQQNAAIALGKPAANGANDRITLWDFEGTGSGYNYAIGAEGNHIWFAMDVDNGTGGFKFYSRDNLAFKIRDNGILESKILTYSVLPAATTAGLRAFISDADTAASGNFGAVVSGGGGNTVPVFSDGSDWRIG